MEKLKNVSIREARGFLRDRQFKIGKRGSRLHDEGGVVVTTIFRALEGKCGRCKHLIIKAEPNGKPGLHNVYLSCKPGYDPIELYRKTPLGKEPTCKGFEKKE